MVDRKFSQLTQARLNKEADEFVAFHSSQGLEWDATLKTIAKTAFRCGAEWAVRDCIGLIEQEAKHPSVNTNSALHIVDCVKAASESE